MERDLSGRPFFFSGLFQKYVQISAYASTRGADRMKLLADGDGRAWKDVREEEVLYDGNANFWQNPIPVRAISSQPAFVLR